MLGALVVLAIVCIALIAAGVHDRAGHRRHVEHLLAAQDAERWVWQRERWDLITRLQSPELVRQVPPPPPPAPRHAPGQGPAEPLPYQDPEPDESHMIGEVIARLGSAASAE